MAEDPKRRRYPISYEGGTATMSLGLIEYLFPGAQVGWGVNPVGTTPTGRRRYKYGSRKRNNAAAGTEVLMDFGEDGVFTARVTGDVIDFIDKVLSAAQGKLLRAYTKRGTVYGPTVLT